MDTKVVNLESSNGNKRVLGEFLETGEFVCSTDMLNDGRHKFIVLMDGGRIVAYVLVRFMPKSLEVVQIYSHHQGKGFGRKAMEEVEALANYHGSRCIFLESLRKARGFYKKIGYRTGDGKRYRKCLRQK